MQARADGSVVPQLTRFYLRKECRALGSIQCSFSGAPDLQLARLQELHAIFNSKKTTFCQFKNGLLPRCAANDLVLSEERVTVFTFFLTVVAVIFTSVHPNLIFARPHYKLEDSVYPHQNIVF